MKKKTGLFLFIITTIAINLPQTFLQVGSMSFASSSPVPNATATTVDKSLDLLETVNELVSKYKSCDLPCFWSFKPGQSRNHDVETFIRNNLGDKLANNQSPSDSSISLFNETDPTHALSLDFKYENDILSLLHINLRYPEEWLTENPFRISNLLKEVNFSDIYIASHVSTGSIGLVLISEDNAVTVEYSLPLNVEGNEISPTVNRPLLLCPTPNSITLITMWLQDKIADEPFDWLASNNPTLPNESVKFYQPVKWMTGLEVDAFIKRIIDNPDKCIEMISYPELRKRGYGW